MHAQRGKIRECLPQTAQLKLQLTPKTHKPMRGSRRDRKLCDKMGFRTAARAFLLPPYSLTSSLLDRQIENWHRKPSCNKRCLTIEPRYKKKLTESKQPYQSTPSSFSVPSRGRRRFHQSAFLIPCIPAVFTTATPYPSNCFVQFASRRIRIKYPSREWE